MKGKNQLSSFIQLLKLEKPPVSMVVTVFLLSLLETGASLIVPLFTKQLVDQVSGAGLKPNIIVLLVSAFVLQTISGGVLYYLLSYIGETIVKGIRTSLWAHILKLPISYFDKHQSGETMSRITQDTNTIKTLITNHLVTFVSGIISIIGSIIFLLMLDWKMTSIMLTVVPLSLLILMPIGRKMYKISKMTQDEMASFSGNLGRVLGEIRLVKSYSGEEAEGEKGREGVQNLFRFGLREARIQAIISPFITTIMMLALVVLIGYGGVRVASGELTAGALVAIIIYMFQIIVPFTQLASFFTAFQKAMGATERIHELFQMNKEEDKAGEEKLVSKDLHFENVSFSYQNEKPILQDVSFSVPSGKTVALVGPSGSGKTTIFSLIERFYSPVSGKIKIGGKDIKEESLLSWRKQIGYVSQESPVMSGTITDNICYGLGREASEEEIRHAAKMANAADFIEKLPDSYQTEVGERGIKLSGGQRQRIAIARAILRNPSFLLLDEATSSLDSESEGLVQEALGNLMKGRTTFVIAHRLSTVVDSDQILVLEKGAITGQGTHEELYHTHPLYRKLASQQLQTAKD
ncbi:ABC transporter ATP-binding protein/permease [Metabacillus sp. GX 13764]|uniref:ABC transporter ATP-binding protein n=1 Tax=Metabacillus kandeliae TaxID=2900151 RepID=UPI001E3D6A3F|nr:ABC transporter ATP-binding protein [Metabacillus kandeliae]MCD7036522.1 ABC transporter ATP-binding protein/permease [Metabacillus kandeliae]